MPLEAALGTPCVGVLNPLSREEAALRTGLLPGLLAALALNASHRQEDVRLFEVGNVYRPAGEDPAARPEERLMLGMALAGRWPSTWRASGYEVAFYDVKGMIEGMGRALGVPVAVVPGRRLAFLHPGRQAEVHVGGKRAGWIGEVHPERLKGTGLGRVQALEIDLGQFAAASRPPAYRPLPRFPAVERDLAVVVGEGVPYTKVEEAVKEAGARWLEEVRLFDLYRGDQVGEGRKSLAFHLAFRAEDRTLVESDVERDLVRIRDKLARLGGVLRT